MKKRLSLLWIFMLLFLLPSELNAAAAPDSIGSVVAIRGKVTAVNPEGVVRKLALKSPVYLEDTLKTGKRSRLQVMFNDNTIVSLGPNSEMIIAEYEWKPDQGDGGMKTKIKEGVFRIMGGAITRAAPDKFVTETPAATIGIRGSMYAGRVSDGSLTVVFQGGRGIYVTNPAGTVDISIPGYGTRVEGATEAPQTPEPFTAEEITDLNNELAATGEAADEEDASNSSGSSDDAEAVENSTTEDTEEDHDPAENPEEPVEGDTQEGSDQPADPQDNTGDDDDSLLAAGSSPSDPDDSPNTDDNPIGVAEPAESLSAGVSNDLAGEVNLDSGTGDTPFSDTLSDSLATIQDAVNDNIQDELNETEVETVVAGTSEPTETVTTVTVKEETTTTTTILTVETTTTTTTTIQTTTTTNPPPAPIIANLSSGKYIAVQYDMNTGTDAGDAIWSGDIAPQSTDGLVEGTATAVEDGKEIPYQFQIATYDDAGTYTGDTIGPADHTVDLVGQDRTFNDLVNLHWSDLGEFIIFYLPTSGFDSGNYDFQELGFAGIPSSSLPSDGVEAYSGYTLAAITEPSNIDADVATFEMEANWHNGKVVGRIDSTDCEIVFIGDVSGTSLTNVQFFGDGKTDSTPSAVEGGADFSQFYGSQYQGVGMVASGTTYGVYDQAGDNTWSAVGAGFRVYEDPLTHPVAPTGSALWEGFATGRADDMDDPAVNRRLYLSSTASDLQFSVDKDAGTLSGTLNADDVLGSGYQIIGMTVGGGNGSAFVMQDNLAAGLGGGGSVITHGVDSGGLKTHGNYMVSMPPDDQFSEYVTWGYWEAAYVDPTSGAQYHIHKPGSLWIAGERTPAAYVQDFITNTQFLGTYQGPAQGIEISGAGGITALTGGATDLTIDFSEGLVANQISGTISFDQVAFTVAGLTANSSGFTVDFTDAGVQTSAVQGAYFGPNAEAIGGNFHADMLSGEQYLGIFGGNKIP